MDPLADNDDDARESRTTIDRFWPAVIAYAVAMLTQQAERPDQRSPWHVLGSFELNEWIDSLDPQLNSLHVETVLREGIPIVRDALTSAGPS